MYNKKTVIRFFTIADYEDEEIWLHFQLFEDAGRRNFLRQ